MLVPIAYPPSNQWRLYRPRLIPRRLEAELSQKRTALAWHHLVPSKRSGERDDFS